MKPACNLIHMYARRLLAVMDGHFNAGSCIAVLSASCPLPLLSIGQHGTAAVLGSVVTAPAQQSGQLLHKPQGNVHDVRFL